MIGSKPTHSTWAFSQAAQAGKRWSQRFLRSRQRLQAETLRKEEAEEEYADEDGDVALGSSGGLLSVDAGRVRFRPATAGDGGELLVIYSSYLRAMASWCRRRYQAG